MEINKYALKTFLLLSVAVVLIFFSLYLFFGEQVSGLIKFFEPRRVVAPLKIDSFTFDCDGRERTVNVVSNTETDLNTAGFKTITMPYLYEEKCDRFTISAHKSDIGVEGELKVYCGKNILWTLKNSTDFTVAYTCQTDNIKARFGII